MSQKFSEFSVDELKLKDRELREKLFKLRFQHGIRRLDNPAQLCTIKKEIARVQTALTASLKK